MRTILFALFAAALAFGCDETDNGTDSGGARDSGGGTSDGGRDRDSGRDIDGGRVDSGSTDDAGPVDGGGGGGPAHCTGSDLLIEAVDPGTSITLFNPTSGTITVDTDNWSFCEPRLYDRAGMGSPVDIAAGARASFTWPSSFTSDNSGGELILYRLHSFTPSNIADFVCWGSGTPRAADTRKSEAEGQSRWSGDCAPAVSGLALVRREDTDGTGAASYDATASSTASLSCP